MAASALRTGAAPAQPGPKTNPIIGPARTANPMKNGTATIAASRKRSARSAPASPPSRVSAAKADCDACLSGVTIRNDNVSTSRQATENSPVASGPSVAPITRTGVCVAASSPALRPRTCTPKCPARLRSSRVTARPGRQSTAVQAITALVEISASH
jgi:hypothetical protein